MGGDVDTYNGWTNRETWLVNLWLGDDPYWADRFQEFAGDAVEASRDDDDAYRHLREVARLADRMLHAVADYWETVADPALGVHADGTLWGDLLDTALDRVDWRQLATVVLDEWVDGRCEPNGI